MWPAIEDGFVVVRDALRSEVDAAVARREMKVIQRPQPGQDADPANDTVLGSCLDIDHSPLDDGHACRHDFLSCLSCPNARALPRHLPMQLAVADRLSTLRGHLSVEDWTQRHAGHLAQLEDVLNSYTAAQREQARTEITQDQLRIVTHLFAGALDPT